MSTKIWVAYKLKDPTSLWSLVHHINTQATSNVQAVLKELYFRVMADVKADTDLYRKTLARYEGDDWSARHSIAHESIRRLYRLSSMSIRRSEWDFNVSLGFRSWRGQVYLIPYSDMLMRGTLDFLKEDKRLQDYHYQNQTDRPKDISAREWESRRKVWNHLVNSKTRKWSDVLVLNICQYDIYYMVDPWVEMSLERNQVKKQAKSKS